MVTTARVPTSPTASGQERTGLPPTCTVQTPHWAMPQPYLVPTRFRWSRNTHKSGMSSGTSTSRDCPLIVKVSIPHPRAAPIERHVRLSAMNALPVAPVPTHLRHWALRCSADPRSDRVDIAEPLLVRAAEQPLGGALRSNFVHRIGSIASLWRCASAQQRTSLFDDLICDGEQVRRYVETEGPRGLEVDH